MAELSLELINLKSFDMAYQYYNTLPNKPEFNYYIEEELFSLDWS